MTPALLEASEWITPLLLLALVAVSMLLRPGREAAQGAAWVARLFLAVGMVLAGGVLMAGPMRIELAAWGPAKLALLADPLSALMLVLVSFLGVVVTRYAVNHLDGDPVQARFSRWMATTLTGVVLLVLSSHALMFTTAAIATSLSLHRLLTVYRARKNEGREITRQNPDADWQAA